MASTSEDSTAGQRIRALFQNAGNATIVAPFIKVDALRSLLQAVPDHIPMTCVTRWLPREVAQGVSDPEALEVLSDRTNATLFLVDRLHAKLYIADNRCLVGSANVTFAGFGENARSGNIEALVETTADNPDIADTLANIHHEAILATQAMADAVRRLADSLCPSDMPSDLSTEPTWFPVSRHPENAYQMYVSPPTGYLRTTDRRLLADIAKSNVRPGLSEALFRETIRRQLNAMPMSRPVLDASRDSLFTRQDADKFIESITTEDWSATDIWIAFVRWMAYFFSDKVASQEVSEIALRRAQVVR